MTVRERFEVYAKARGFYLARAKSGERTYFNGDTEAIYSTFLAAWTAATEAAARCCDERVRAASAVLKTCEFVPGVIGDAVRAVNVAREQEASKCAIAIRARAVEVGA